MKHINKRWWSAILGVFVILVIAGALIATSGRPTLTLDHYEHSEYGSNRVAVLRFTNDTKESVVLNYFLTEGSLTPAYLVQLLEGDEWGEPADGGTPRGSRVWYETQVDVNPGETIPVKVPVSRDGSSFRVGLGYRTHESRSFRASLYRLRWRLAHLRIGSRPDYRTSMETAWCLTTLKAPTQETDYRPMTPEWRYRPNKKLHLPERPEGAANKSAERTGAMPVASDGR